MGRIRNVFNTLQDIFFDADLQKHFVRWIFTWGLATIPIVFIVLKEYVSIGVIDWIEISSNGELFLISIVIVAEPLGSLVILQTNNVPFREVRSLILSFFIIIDLLCCAFLFCVIELNEVRIHHCLAQYRNCTITQRDSVKNYAIPVVYCDSACLECHEYHTIMIAQSHNNHDLTDVLLDIHDNNTMNNDSSGTSFVFNVVDSNNYHTKTAIRDEKEKYDQFLVRMYNMSVICFFWSLCLGAITIIHIR